ncbi:uncharacterized protein LOC117178621 [Belonocnema kinseyi]|uniref:uncharacterized protein LOC117178621 n=1 Tax=Belonocnema kinseyi TaxID=2817044 RepID=UPI00143D929D|nr:uncharacterized protein LOC117178621 [Belonocnema kinseyi]
MGNKGHRLTEVEQQGIEERPVFQTIEPPSTGLKVALVVNYDENTNAKNKSSLNRIAQTAWCNDHEHEHAKILNRRVEYMTSLTVNSSEPLQIAYYEIGGLYLPHHDFIKKDKLDSVIHFKQRGIANRIATVLFYEIKSNPDRERWEQAVKDELTSLRDNKTWILVDRPKDRNIVDCKWIFTVKPDEFGNPTRFKARLVARGFSQQYLVDYDETFAPVERIDSFRLMLAFANQFDLLKHHMDVKTAFLNSELKQEIFMKVPEGSAVDTEEGSAPVLCLTKREILIVRQKNLNKTAAVIYSDIEKCMSDEFLRQFVLSDKKKSRIQELAYELQKNLQQVGRLEKRFFETFPE